MPTKNIKLFVIVVSFFNVKFHGNLVKKNTNLLFFNTVTGKKALCPALHYTLLLTHPYSMRSVQQKDGLSDFQKFWQERKKKFSA